MDSRFATMRKVDNEIKGVYVWLILLKAFDAISAQATRSLRDSGLGESDFRVLEALLHKGPLPVNTIGPKVHLTPGSISVAVDRLYEKGLVSRIDSEHDRRVRIVDLTGPGRTLIRRVFKKHEAEMEALMEPLTQAERAELTGLLKKIGKRAEELAD